MPKDHLASALRLASQGWRVLPVHHPRSDGSCSCARSDCRYIGKHPRISGWLDDASTDPGVIRGWLDLWPTTNIGVAFGRRSGVIDVEVDPRNNGDVSLKQLEALLGKLPTTRRFKSGGGGFHYLYAYPGERRLRKATHVGKDLLGTETTGVDVISDGGMAVVPPSVHVSGNAYVWENPDMRIAELPAKWISYLADPDTKADPNTDIGAALLEEANQVLPDVDIAVAKDFLSFIDANCEYGQWMRVGQALKLQFGESEEAMLLFDKWSASSTEKYPGSSEIAKQWKSYGRGNGNVTFRSVIEMAKEGGWRPVTKTIAPKEEKELRQNDQKQYKDFSKRLFEAADDAEMAEVAAEIRLCELFDSSREQLADDYQEAYTRLHPGKKISKPSVKDLLDDAPNLETRSKDMAEANGWYKPYIYLSDHRQGNYYNANNGSIMSPKVFDDNYSYNLITPIMRAQGKITPMFLPSTLVLNSSMIPKVGGLRYSPGRPLIFSDQGVQFANRYVKVKGDATDPMLWDEAEQAAIDRIEAHGKWLIGEDRFKILRQFMAYIYQNPMERVRWCYVIIGPKGIGKTFWANLVRAAIGHGNVADVGPSTLSHTDFNGWAEGAQLNIIEELRVEGTRKAEIMDSLKAAITNDWINIHRKGIDAYQTRNTASYLAFTNHYNALSVDKGDRRYFITHTVRSTVEAFMEDLGGVDASCDYFSKLFGALGHDEAIRGWLAATDLSDFRPERAPHSHEMDALAIHSRSDLEEAIMSLLNPGCAKANMSIVELSTLKTQLALTEDVEHISPQKLGRVMLAMGFKLLSNGDLIPYSKHSPSRWYIGPNVAWDGGEPTRIIRSLVDAHGRDAVSI